MTTTTHKRSVHIDAPVEKVFEYVKEPEHFYAAFPGQAAPAEIEVTRSEGAGVGTRSEWRGSMLGFHVHGVMTREEFVPNQRIVDRSSTGPLWTLTVEPDQTGTTLALEFDYTSKVPLMDKVVDRVSWKGDRDLDAMLGTIKDGIEG